MMHKAEHKFSFTWREFSGSLGDLGLFLPLVVAMSIAGGLDLGVILIFAGLMNCLTGLLFRQPIPVQPMKAIAVVVITEGILPQELAAAGLCMGLLVLILSFVSNRIYDCVPKAIVRGIQLGVGLKLVLKGVTWVSHLPWIGWDSIVLSLICVCVLLIFLKKNQPVLLYIFLSGFLIVYLEQPGIYTTVALRVPDVHVYWPTLKEFTTGFYKGALPQLPLTMLNSVIAVCALSEQYFPGRGIAPKKMAFSVAVMNLLSVPFGGIPMCHGSGGLAAQYRFGARTGASVIMLGVLKIGIGILFASALLSLLKVYPMAVLGPMLIFAGVKLAESVKDILNRKRDLTVAVCAAGLIIIFNTLAGFLGGVILYLFTRKKGIQSV